MNILGIWSEIDSGAAMVAQGRVLAAANEERFNREKLTKAFPHASVQYVLGKSGISLDQVDWVACGSWAGMARETVPVLMEDLRFQLVAGGTAACEAGLRRSRISAERDADCMDKLYEGLAQLDLPRTKVLLYDHHYGHAAGAFYSSPFEKAVVYTADGRGDHRSVSLWRATRSKGLEFVAGASELVSPGALYGFITKLLGFKPERHEGKITGLAAYGRPSGAMDILRSAFHFDPEGKALRSVIGPRYQPFVSAPMEQLRDELSRFSREEVAFAVQAVLEESMTGFLRAHLAGDEQADLCLAGGCMSNVKLNYELAKLEQVRNVYVFPQMGDGGIALCGAVAATVERGGVSQVEMPTLYMGPEYGESDILKALDVPGVVYRKVDDRERIALTADWIAQGKVVGWFQGGMEYGPRALGHRSIFSSATDPAINDVLNKRLKRTEFMPFAPCMSDVLANDCLLGWSSEHIASRYMTICYDCTEHFKRLCPAVVHVDGTARPQVVFREDNPDVHDLLLEYHRQTGLPAFINTSFNKHEEPIVNTPHEAVDGLVTNAVDVLVIGSFVAEFA